MKAILIAGALIVASTQISAQQQAPFNVIGHYAALSCGGWLELRRTERHHMAFEWAVGFLSGAAWSGVVGNPLMQTGRTDPNAILHWIDRYCRAAPTRPFVTALNDFLLTHRK